MAPIRRLQVLLWIVVIVFLYSFVRVLWLKWVVPQRYRTTFIHEAGLALLLSAWLVVFWITMGQEWVKVLRNGFGGWDAVSYNLKPFVIFRHAYHYYLWEGDIRYFLYNFFGNILLFMVPFFFLCLLYRGWSLMRVIGWGATVSFVIEMMQFPLGRGADIDDLWLNALGSILGYCCFRRIAVRFPDWIEKCRVRVIIKPNS